MTRVGWKLYFFAATALSIATVVTVVHEAAASFDDILFAPLYILQLIGLFGIAFWRPIAKQSLWRAIFALTVLQHVWEFCHSWHDILIPEIDWFILIIVALYFSFSIPLWVGLYLYAFRYQNLWQRVAT